MWVCVWGGGGGGGVRCEGVRVCVYTCSVYKYDTVCVLRLIIIMRIYIPSPHNLSPPPSHPHPLHLSSVAIQSSGEST